MLCVLHRGTLTALESLWKFLMNTYGQSIFILTTVNDGLEQCLDYELPVRGPLEFASKLKPKLSSEKSKRRKRAKYNSLLKLPAIACCPKPTMANIEQGLRFETATANPKVSQARPHIHVGPAFDLVTWDRLYEGERRRQYRHVSIGVGT